MFGKVKAKFFLLNNCLAFENFSPKNFHRVSFFLPRNYSFQSQTKMTAKNRQINKIKRSLTIFGTQCVLTNDSMHIQRKNIDEKSFKKQKKVSFWNIKMHSVCNVKICLKYDGTLNMEHMYNIYFYYCYIFEKPVWNVNEGLIHMTKLLPTLPTCISNEVVWWLYSFCFFLSNFRRFFLFFLVFFTFVNALRIRLADVFSFLDWNFCSICC